MATISRDPGPWSSAGGFAKTALDPSSLSNSSSTSEMIADGLAEEMAGAWRRGERVLTEEMLVRHPGLDDESDVVLRLIYEEVCQRQDRGEEIPPEEIFRRFPRWESELGALLASHEALEHWLTSPRWPEPGKPLGGFIPLDELGRGARGRVYLAIQPHLADRPVVLKLTPRDGTEHLALARLQHTHIVPLYSLDDFADHGLRGLCMPYLGGTTIARLLEAWRERPARRRAGRDFVDALDAAEASAVIDLPGRGSARNLLARSTYVQAVCWIGACLADALQYAHERGIVHLDLKPSNVLIAGDGQPMLLDFHLARGPITPEGATFGNFGGTLAYMAPEQREALAALSEHRPIPGPVDGRADLYSLGLILYELLGGTVRGPRGAARARLGLANPEVSPGLEAIIDRCLEADPQDRYPDAATLASDLRRHLAHLPLTGVANRSLAERLGKWRRRRPHAAGWLALLVVASAVFLSVGVLGIRRVDRRMREARAALSLGQDQIHRRQFADAVRTLDRGIASAACFPGDRDLSLSLGRSLRLAKESEAASELEDVAERARSFRDLNSRPRSELEALARSCREVWEQRRVLARAATGVGDVTGRRNQENLIDVIVLLAELEVRLAPRGQDAEARRVALRLLDALEAEAGPSLVIVLERLELAPPDGPDTPKFRPDALVPRTAREHEALGRHWLRAGELDRAAAEFDRALEIEPNAFWPNFSQGLCAYRMRRFEDAVNAFRVCIALAPRAVPCYFNRALAYLALGRTDRARRDLDRVLGIDPTHPEALLDRGTLSLHQGRPTEALDDLRRGLAAGADPVSAHYHLALACQELGDRDSAKDHLEQVLRLDPGNCKARLALDRLRESPAVPRRRS